MGQDVKTQGTRPAHAGITAHGRAGGILRRRWGRWLPGTVLRHRGVALHVTSWEKIGIQKSKCGPHRTLIALAPSRGRKLNRRCSKCVLLCIVRRLSHSSGLSRSLQTTGPKQRGRNPDRPDAWGTGSDAHPGPSVLAGPQARRPRSSEFSAHTRAGPSQEPSTSRSLEEEPRAG